MSESKFNQLFRKNLETASGIKTYRFESHSTAPGSPDNHYITRDGITGWIEMKEEQDSMYPSAVNFRPAQVPWLIDYERRGGRCFVAVHVPMSRRLLLIPGCLAREALHNLRQTECWVFDLDHRELWKDVASILSGSLVNHPPNTGGQSNKDVTVGQLLDGDEAS